MSLVMYQKDGKVRLLIDVKFEGMEEGDTPRLNLLFEQFNHGEVKVFRTAPRLEELSVENGRVFIAPEQPFYLQPILEPFQPGPREHPTSITYISTIREKCGIATYTSFLAGSMKKHCPVTVWRKLDRIAPQTLVHVQCEFGIFPCVEDLIGEKVRKNYKVITWHTVLHNPIHFLEYYMKVDREYDAHLVHTVLAKKWLAAYTSKPIYYIPHGSVIFKPIDKTEARKRLGLPLDAEIAFCFGFAAESKGFTEVIEVAKKMRKRRPKLMVVMNAAVHGVVKDHSEKCLGELRRRKIKNTLILGSFLSEEEINLYASACDCLVFNYKTPRFVASASGAMHRVLASAKPTICPQDNRLIELVDGHHALKFKSGDLEDLERCLELVLSDDKLAEALGRNARLLAEETSWDRTAEKHLQVYEKTVGEELNEQS